MGLKNGKKDHGLDHTTKKREKSSDKWLIEQMKAGDQEAYQIFYRRFKQRLYNFIYYQIGGNAEDAHEIFQETLLAALQSLPSFKGKSRLSSWLYAIARNKISDYYRHYRAQKRFIPHHQVPGWFEFIDEKALPEEILQRKETSDVVRDTLYSLPPHYRQALILHHSEDMPVREVAQIMKKSLKATESILHRAREALKKSLSRKGSKSEAVIRSFIRRPISLEEQS